MGPRRKRFWLPLARLGAFFVAVVAIGNVVLHAFRPEAADFTATPDQSVDYYAQKKRRLQRQFYRTMEKFLGAPAKEKLSGLPVVEPVAETVVATVQCLGPSNDPIPPTATASLTPLPPPGASRLAVIEPAAAPLAW